MLSSYHSKSPQRFSPEASKSLKAGQVKRAAPVSHDASGSPVQHIQVVVRQPNPLSDSTSHRILKAFVAYLFFTQSAPEAQQRAPFQHTKVFSHIRATLSPTSSM